MAGSDVDSVTSLFSKTSVDHVNELSFAGRKMKLDTADDGVLFLLILFSCL